MFGTDTFPQEVSTVALASTIKSSTQNLCIIFEQHPNFESHISQLTLVSLMSEILQIIKPFNQFLSYLIIWNFSLALTIVILSSRVSLSPPQPPISAESSNTADKKTSQRSHIPLIYGSLHWHPLKFRIIFKFLLLTYIIYITYIYILTYKDLIAATNLFDQPIMVSLLSHALILKPEVITLSLQCSPQTLEQPSSAYHVC